MSIHKKIILAFWFALLIIVGYTGAVYYVRHEIRLATEHSRQFFSLAVTAKQMQLDIIQVQQWLTDISATRGLDGLDDGFAEAEKSRQSFLQGVETFRDAYRDMNAPAKIKQLDTIVARFDNYYEVGKKMAQAYIEDGPRAGNKMMAEFDAAAKKLHQIFDPFVQENLTSSNNELDGVEKLLLLLFWGGVIILMAILIVSPLVLRSIVAPLRQISGEVQGSAEQVAAAAGQISASSQSLAQGASEQSASLVEISASVDKVSTMIRNDADNLQQADALVKESGATMAKADDGMKRLMAAMTEISAASEDTQKIVKSIDEIAFQTNLLALNAAVEAARAGEAGAGFAVVADEVRNLAMRAAEAARTTSQLIEETIQKVTDGNNLVSEVNESFLSAAKGSEQIGIIVGQIAASAREQAQAIEQVSQAMNQIETVTQDQAAASQETASASEQLNAQAEMMQEIARRLARMVDDGSKS